MSQTVTDTPAAPAVPATAKQPQDRKPKKPKQPQAPTPAELAAGDAVHTVTFHGKQYDVHYAAMDDIEVYEAFERALAAADTEAGDVVSLTSTVTAMRAILGAKQFGRWKDEQKAIHGRVGAALMQDFMEQATPGNS